MPQKEVKMDSTGTVKLVAKLTDRLRAFANETNVPRSLTVSDTELESLESSAIIQLLWLACTNRQWDFVVSVEPGYSPNMPQLITFTLYPKEAHIHGIMSSSPTLSVTLEKELKHDYTPSD